MWKPIYQPESWPQFVRRKDIIGLPLMEQKKKYMEEQLLFENYVSTLNTTNTVSTVAAGAAGGPSSSPSPSPSPTPPGEALTYHNRIPNTPIPPEEQIKSTLYKTSAVWNEGGNIWVNINPNEFGYRTRPANALSNDILFFVYLTSSLTGPISGYNAPQGWNSLINLQDRGTFDWINASDSELIAAVEASFDSPYSQFSYRRLNSSAKPVSFPETPTGSTSPVGIYKSVDDDYFGKVSAIAEVGVTRINAGATLN